MNDAIKVDVWSDIQCPWCYIGKRRFESAVEQFGGEVEIEYHSFELAPDTPVDYVGTPVDFLSEHKGMPREQVQQMLQHVTSIAEDVGLDYDFGAVHQTNTVKAHELLHFARMHGRQAEMKERLLAAYFINGEHVGRIEDLADIAEELGYDRDAVVEALESGEFASAVEEDVARARSYGIQGVPFFVFEGKYGVSGAQEPAVFVQALQQVASERSDG